MENTKEKRTKEQAEEENQQVNSQPVAEGLSDADLDDVAGGASNLNLSKSNIN